MAGVLSKGIVFSSKVLTVETPITNLLEVPELGGKVDKVEVTTLSDSSKKFIPGIKDYGDLEFKFLYDNSSATSNYRVLKAMEVVGGAKDFTIKFPDNTAFAFSGSVMTTINSAKVGDALTFSVSITLNSDIVVTNPTV
jgi:hypothetical protein